VVAVGVVVALVVVYVVVIIATAAVGVICEALDFLHQQFVMHCDPQSRKSTTNYR